MTTHHKLMALAVAGIFAAPALVYAQASTVNVYGRMNLHFENAKSSGAGGLPQRNRVNNYGGTAIGFRGSEKLGGGLSAVFQIESNVTGDGTGGANTLGSRNTGVGLRGGFGTVMLGHWDMPYKLNLSALSQTGLTGAPGTTSIMANGNAGSVPAPGGVAFGTAAFSVRANNSVIYHSPNWNGFEVKAQYGANEAKSTTRNAYLWGASAAYRQGPIYAGVGYERHEDWQGPGTDNHAWNIGGHYTFFGTTRVGLVYERLRYEPTTTTTLRRDAWMGNISHRMGPHQIIGNYMRASNSKGNSPIGLGMIGAATLPDTGAYGWALQYKYFFSKRTQLVGTFAQVKNKTNALYDFQGGGNPIRGAAGSDPRAFAIGIDHRF